MTKSAVRTYTRPRLINAFSSKLSSRFDDGLLASRSLTMLTLVEKAQYVCGAFGLAEGLSVEEVVAAALAKRPHALTPDENALPLEKKLDVLYFDATMEFEP